MQDLDPSDICKKNFLNPLKRIRVIIRTPTHGRTDRQTDGQTDGRTGWIQYTPPQLRCGGYNNGLLPDGTKPSSDPMLTCLLEKKGKSEGFDSCDRPSNLTQNWIQIIDFPARVTLKFNGWPRKIIGHLFYTTPSFVHHFKTMGEFKLELQSGNAQFGSKSMFSFKRSRNAKFRRKKDNFFVCVNLKFDRWPWNTIGHLFYASSSFVHHFVAIGEFKLWLQSGNA